MTQIELDNLIERNKQLEHENKVLRDIVISFLLSENSEVAKLKHSVAVLEEKNKKLSSELLQTKMFF